MNIPDPYADPTARPSGDRSVTEKPAHGNIPDPYADPVTRPHVDRPTDTSPTDTSPTDPFARIPAAGAAAAPPAAPDEPGARPGLTGLLVSVAIGTLVAVGLGVYGSVHVGANFAFNVGGFSSGLRAKVWLTTIAFVLALVQLVSALIMYGRVPAIPAPSWIGALHRWSGRAAVLVTVPVAVHCLYAFGFGYYEPRVVAHSLFGCFFYGAFVAKMLVLGRRGTPWWSLPVLGGAVFTGLAVLWLTSSVWVFSTSGFSL